MNLLEEIQGLPRTRRAVQHEPETPRYARARAKLEYVVREAVYLGTRGAEREPEAVEIAVWARPGHGQGFGYYCCFRLFLDKGTVRWAVLFCFYDGTEGSPGFKSVDAARAYARSHGFNGVGHGDH